MTKNEKISKSLKLYYQDKKKQFKHVCPYCKNVFTNRKSYSKFCSRYCASKYNNENKIIGFGSFSKDEQSKIHKIAYDNGRKVSGGTTKWYNYNNIKVQGTYELRACKILDKMKQLNLIYSWEYTNDRIKYLGIDNKIHNYLLDFKVYNLDNSIEYIEVKGYKTKIDELKWEAAKQQNIKLTIWYLKDIKTQEIKFSIN